MDNPEKVEAYKCLFCSKLYRRESNCIKHLVSCKKNPENKRACYGCKHLSKQRAVYPYDTAYGSSEMEVELLHCSAFKKFVFTPQVALKGNWYDVVYIDGEEIANNPMPKECAMFTHYSDGYLPLD